MYVIVSRHSAPDAFRLHFQQQQKRQPNRKMVKENDKTNSLQYQRAHLHHIERLNFTSIASKVPKSWWMGDGIVAVDTSARSLGWLTCRWNGPILTIAKLSRLLNDRFDVELFALELCDNNELLIESLSSVGKSNFVIIFLFCTIWKYCGAPVFFRHLFYTSLITE